MEKVSQENKSGTTGMIHLLLLLFASAIGVSLLAPAHVNMVPWPPTNSPYIVAK